MSHFILHFTIDIHHYQDIAYSSRPTSAGDNLSHSIWQIFPLVVQRLLTLKLENLRAT